MAVSDRRDGAGERHPIEEWVVSRGQNERQLIPTIQYRDQGTRCPLCNRFGTIEREAAGTYENA